MNGPRRVPVRHPGGAYDITIDAGLLDRVGDLLAPLLPLQRAIIVTNDTVGPIYAERVEASLRRAGCEPHRVTIPDGESHKNLDTFGELTASALRATIERTTPLIALGGGVIGDMAGFAAAVLLRGVPLVQIPTSLLAMVDASVGGKTGINHAVGKNLLGAFIQPHGVLIDPAVLQTLPPRELRGGLAECVKHEILSGDDGFATLESEIDRVLAGDVNVLADLVTRNVAIKAAVVAADPYEHGIRAHLNLGHTVGHAIEAESDYAYSHGESVSLGLCAATDIAVRLGLCDVTLRDRIETSLNHIGLPTRGLTCDIDAVFARLVFDKKVTNGRIRFVLPTRLGEVVIRNDVPANTVREAIARLRR